MFQIDPETMPPAIADILDSRHGTPPLDWSANPRELVRDDLTDTAATRLFEPLAVADPDQATNVRGLLLIFSGLMDEALAALEASGHADAPYVRGLANRHLGFMIEARSQLHRTRHHAIHEQLVRFAVEHITDACSAPVGHYEEQLRRTGQWDPAGFIELMAQTRNGVFSLTDDAALSEIQFAEFNLLLRHCFAVATGGAVYQAPPTAANATAPTPEPSPARPSTTPRTTRIRCPKCTATVSIHNARPGQLVRCTRCSGGFMVPDRQRAA